MPGHLLLYHPGVAKLKELVDAGDLGDVLCVYGNRQNLGVIRPNENALWSLGVHDLSVILYLLDEEPSRRSRTGATSSSRASRTSSSATSASRPGRSRTCTSPGSTRTRCGRSPSSAREKMAVFDDMELERKVTVYEKAPWEPAETYGEWRHAYRRHLQPEDRERRAAAARVQHFLQLVDGGTRRPPRGAATGSPSCGRSSG